MSQESSGPSNGPSSGAHNQASQKDIQRTYGDNALLIARCMLIAHSSGRPVRKRDLMDALKEPNGEVSRVVLKRELGKANVFLKEKLWMQIVELEPVKLHDTRLSPNRDEVMLVSLAHGYRSMLHKVVSEAQLLEWGTVCFALSLIVLKGDGIPLSELLHAFSASRIYPNASQSTSDSSALSEAATITKTMHKLVAQRIFEVVKRPVNANGQGEESTTPRASAEEPQEVFYIGPYAKHLISGRELYVIMLKMHFPTGKPHTPEFQKAHAVAMRSLSSKIENTGLGSVHDH